MPAIVTSDVRVFSANQMLNAFQNTKYEPWVTGTAYTSGDVRYNGNYKYIATTTGTSGATAPNHTSGTVSDGGVDWLFIEEFENTENFDNNLYIAIGRVNSWDNPSAGGEVPITPVDDHTIQYDRLKRIISAKRLSASDASQAVLRYDWDVSASTVYDQYDPGVEAFEYTNPFYVVTDDNNIYKCLNNNGGAVSNTKPTGTSTDPFSTPGDGYTWKYMGTISSSDLLKFATSSYIPVALKHSDDGSGQWNVQQNAKKNSLSTIVVDAGGSGYTTATVTVDPPTSGTTATASAILSGGVITGIQLSNVGEGYDTIPGISITGDGSGASATAILAPKSGHGANIVQELNARYITINSRFDDGESGYFPTSGENDFRQIQILVDPLDVNGNPAEATRYIGPDHDDRDGAETSGKSELMAGSGSTLYIENIAPVVRQPGQIEDIKISLKF